MKTFEEVPLQTVDRQTLDTTNARYNQDKTYQTLVMSYVILCLMFIMSSVCCLGSIIVPMKNQF